MSKYKRAESSVINRPILPFYFISIWYSLNIDPNNIYRNLQRTFKIRKILFNLFKIK